MYRHLARLDVVPLGQAQSVSVVDFADAFAECDSFPERRASQMPTLDLGVLHPLLAGCDAVQFLGIAVISWLGARGIEGPR